MVLVACRHGSEWERPSRLCCYPAVDPESRIGGQG